MGPDVSHTARMSLDNKNLGRLVHVADPRTIWTSESGDFTPWLAENIDVLADALGMTLTVTATEVPVGGFRLDIRAETEDGGVVVIENQLERTDHGHLGQCLVYASGLDAVAVVWISPRFRDEFRRALDWLNERTDVKVAFFGVEVGVVRIGDTGPCAPVFEVVSRPNNWQKNVKAADAGASSQSNISPLNAARQNFFLEVLTDLTECRPAIRLPSMQRANWLSFASGPFGYWCISIPADGRVRVEAYLDTGDGETNKRIFDTFAANQPTWADQTGLELSFERLNERRASRIAAYHPVALDEPNSEADARSWAVATLTSMYDALNGPLRNIAAEIRKTIAIERDTKISIAHDPETDTERPKSDMTGPVRSFDDTSLAPPVAYTRQVEDRP